LSWFFDDGTVLVTQDTVCHAFATAGPHQVVLQAEGCGTHTDTLFLNVLPSPVINLQLGAPSVCDGEAVQINAATQGCDVWLHFGDGDTTLFDNVAHMYDGPGTYTISAFALSIPDGCFADTSVQVLVRPLPIANLNLPPQPYCAPGVFVMSAAGSLGAAFYNWSLSNGETAIGSNVSLPVQLPGQYQVSLNVSDAFGCSDDTLFYPLVVHERPDAAFTFTAAQLCGVPVNVTFTNASVGASGFVWSSSNGQTSTQVAPTFTYATEAAYTVTLVASNQFFCTDTAQHDFATLAMPSATISADKEQICLGDSITLTAVGDPYAQTFTWLLDNGVVITNADTAITYSYPDAGNYFPQLVVGNQGVCFDTTTADLLINVYPVPVADFTFAPQTLPSSTHPTGYYDFLNTSQNASTYLWSFGDGAESDEVNPTHRYLEGVHSYPVILVATANTGCADTTIQMLATAALNGLYIPNAFTPSLPDNAVNEFRPKGANLVRFNVSVYSEWGDLVWRTTEQDLDAFGAPTRAWDGTLNGTPLPAGAYTWKASGIFNDGSAWQGMDFGDGRLRTEGTLMLIR
jgi:PKD repeat protein